MSSLLSYVLRRIYVKLMLSNLNSTVFGINISIFFNIFIVIMPRNKYKDNSSKPSVSPEEIKNIADAIKALHTKSTTERKIAKQFNVERSKLQRFMKKVKQAALDLDAISNEELIEIVSNLCGAPSGKTVIYFTFNSFYCFISFLIKFSFRFSQPFRKINLQSISSRPVIFNMDWQEMKWKYLHISLQKKLMQNIQQHGTHT